MCVCVVFDLYCVVVEAVCVSVCVCVCVCVCVHVCVVCVTSPRWRHGGHEVAGEDSNFGGIHAEVAHFLQMEGAVRVRGTRRASDTAPHRRRVPLLSWVRPQYHQDQQFSASLDLHSSVPPYHHTPWGLSSWQSDRSTLTASSGYGDRSTWRASTACFTAMAPSCRSP